MENKTNRPTYQPPMAVDLSVRGVDGMRPFGECTGGSVPYNLCNVGTSVASGTACSPTGVLESYPSCDSGSTALVACLSVGSTAH